MVVVTERGHSAQITQYLISCMLPATFFMKRRPKFHLPQYNLFIWMN